MKQICKKLSFLLALCLLLSCTAPALAADGDPADPPLEGEQAEGTDSGDEDGLDTGDNHQEDQDGGDGSAPAPAPAARRGVISGVNPARWSDGQQTMNDAAYLKGSSRSVNLGSLRVSPGSELRIYLDADMFLDEDGNPFGGAAEGVTLAELKKGRVSISVRNQQNPSLVEEISLAYDRDRSSSYIKIKFVETMSGGGQRTVSAAIRLRVGGSIAEETEFLFITQMSNTQIKLTADTDYVLLDSATYASSDDYIRRITVDLGSGVTIVTSMFDGTKYYGNLTVAQAPPADNAEIALCYQLAQQNLGTMGVTRFQLDQLYYVYNANGEYLGTTRDEIPVERTYYLTLEQVEELEVEGRSEGGEAGSGGSSRGGGRGRG